jgi:hypothetical protein
MWLRVELIRGLFGCVTFSKNGKCGYLKIYRTGGVHRRGLLPTKKQKTKQETENPATLSRNAFQPWRK